MLSIRNANASDVKLILELIRGLAEYERSPDAVKTTEADLLRDGFGQNSKFQCLLAEWNGDPAGYAFYFFTYSTWLGRPGIYLEDLFVLPAMRGKGIGLALLQKLAQVGVEENCYGMKWQVLDWNETAIKFYKSIGASELEGWDTMRLMEPAFSRLARGEKAAQPVDEKTFPSEIED